jgi:hypothetical protein
VKENSKDLIKKAESAKKGSSHAIAMGFLIGILGVVSLYVETQSKGSVFSGILNFLSENNRNWIIDR